MEHLDYAKHISKVSKENESLNENEFKHDYIYDEDKKNFFHLLLTKKKNTIYFVSKTTDNEQLSSYQYNCMVNELLKENFSSCKL